MSISKDFLIQIAIVILPVFLYEIFRLSRYYVTEPTRKKGLIGIFFNLSALLCLMYPVESGNEITSLHFLMIIMMNGMLYGGWKVGFSILVTATVYWSFFSESSWLLYFQIIFYSIIPLLLSKNWYSNVKETRIIYGILLCSMYVLTNTILYAVVRMNHLLSIEQSSIGIYLLTLSVFMFTMILQIYLHEYIYENALIRLKVYQNEKMNVVGELAASVAHEVRNPLTIVRGFIQLMKLDTTEQNDNYYNLILTELDRAEEIMNDYLNLSRPQKEKEDKFNVSETMKDVSSVMYPFAMLRRVEITTKIRDNLYMYGDELKIKQAIMNIMKNGIESMEGRQGVLHINLYRDSENIIFQFQDNGIGMTKEQIKKVGQPFYSLKEKGTGLGLMVTFRIIEAHGGKIKYRSKVRKGTEVEVKVPYRKQEESL